MRGRPSDGIKYDENHGRIRARGTFVLVNQEKIRLQAFGGTEREAERAILKKLDDKNKEIEYGRRSISDDITLAEAVRTQIDRRKEEYDRVKGRLARRDTSAKRDEDVYKFLLLKHEISVKPMGQIFFRDVEEYRRWLSNAKHKKGGKEQYYSPTSLNRIIRLVNAAFDEFYKYSEKKSPSSVLEPFKQPLLKKEEDDFLIGDEVTTFLDYLDKVRTKKRFEMDPWYADIFAITIMTAGRPGELRGIKRKDWDEKKNILSIKRTGEYEDRRTKTADSIRSLPVVSEAAEILNRISEGRNPEEYLFSADGKKLLDYSNGKNKLKRWLKEAGITKNLHWHSLRGSAGSFMLEHGMHMEDVSVLMGHASISTTEKFYTWYTEKKKRESLNVMEGAYKKKN